MASKLQLSLRAALLFLLFSNPWVWRRAGPSWQAAFLLALAYLGTTWLVMVHPQLVLL